jgi:hypothetical protein
MSIILKSKEVCPYANTCKHNTKSPTDRCQGADYTRESEFICDLVTEAGIIKEDGFRSKLDKTGKMQILFD